MKYLVILIIISILLMVLACCAPKKKAAPLNTVPSVDLEKYTGRWFEIARYPHRFEKGCSSVTADYSLQDDGTIEVLNQCRREEDGNRIKKARGKAKVVDTQSNAKLKVTFFWPFYGDYWILKLDSDYQYAIVGTPSREYVWLLSRTPIIREQLLEKLIKDIRSFGYDTDRLIMTEQP